MTAAAHVLSHLISRQRKTAASLLATAVKNIIPAFKSEVPAISNVGIKPVLKPSVMANILPRSAPNSVPLLRSQPALQAKSVFRATTGGDAPKVVPTAPAARPATPEYEPGVEPDAVGKDIDKLKFQERSLAGAAADPSVTPSAKAQVSAKLKELYDQIAQGPALELSNPVGHAEALADQGFMGKLRRGMEARRLEAEANAAKAPTEALPNNETDRLPPSEPTTDF